MTTEKSVNYTEEQTRAIVASYQAGEAVEQIAQAVGKSVRSVISKLSREGVYKAKAKQTVAKNTKAQTVAKISALINVEYAKLETLEKANAEALEFVLTALADVYQVR